MRSCAGCEVLLVAVVGFDVHFNMCLVCSVQLCGHLMLTVCRACTFQVTADQRHGATEGADCGAETEQEVEESPRRRPLLPYEPNRGKPAGYSFFSSDILMYSNLSFEVTKL